MNLTPGQAALGFIIVLAFLTLAYFTERSVPPPARPVVRYAAAAITIGAFFWYIQTHIDNHDVVVNWAKLVIAATAAGAVFYEQHRIATRRPVAERWKKFVGICLALAAISAYFNGFRFGYPKYYHRWDQYHYYMGAKYFGELGFDGLYKCAVIAQDDLGVVRHQLDKAGGATTHPTRSLDMRREVRDPDTKVRNLSGDNLLMPVGTILDDPAECRDRFSTERWDEYKQDVAFFRIVSGKGYWSDMQKDHGFNPPPVWTILGKFFGGLAPASVAYLQFLASLDILYLIGMFVALYWGFGWRVFAAGAIFWGCQSSAPFYWTGGAFLRQDWLFFSVLSVACYHKRHFKLGGAALVYAGLLRIFPGLVVIGALVPVIAHVIDKRRMHRDHLQALFGGCLAAAVLIPVSLYTCGVSSYQKFYEHTLQVHDQTPLTNHMGLRVIIAHQYFDYRDDWVSERALPIKMAEGKESGRMRYTRDNSLTDPFEVWKRMRNERFAELKWVRNVVVGLTLLVFWVIVRRLKLLWVAQCLGQIFIILLSQLTCYYYSFMILGAPLIKVRKHIELGLYGLAIVTQVIWLRSHWNDDKYTALTVASLLWCYTMLGFFWRRKQKTAAAEQEAPHASAAVARTG